MTSSRTDAGPRELIAASAQTLFETNGYAGTSVRQIASAAGVDPSLVIRHFGSKEALFIKVIGLDGYVDPPIAGPIESLGRRLAAFALAPESDEFRVRLTVLMRDSDRVAVREGLRLTVRRMFIDQLVDVLQGDDRSVRAELIAAQLGGLVQSTVATDSKTAARLDVDQVIELYGRAIQTLVDPT
jgi:AcrR family transcriptional regulator